MEFKIRKQTLSLKRKIDLIHAVEMNPEKKRKDTADEFGIKPSTLSGILKGKEKYKYQYYSGQTDVQKMRARPPKHKAVDIALLHWYSYARSNDIPLSGSIMKMKAEELSRHLGVVDWKCSEGWLHRFKKRHNISYKALSDERQLAVEQSVHTQWFEDVLKPTLMRYDPRNVFCAAETGLFWRLLPDETIAFTSEQCYDGKKSKERLTVMVCANMDGTEKIPLLTIGKFHNPLCFQGIKKLPVKYVANSKAWITSELFNDWLGSFDHDMNCQDRKVLLAVSNCPALPKAQIDLKATELLYLPPTAMTKMQPCRQGIIQNLKVHYRTASLLKLFHHIDTGGAAGDFKITLLDAVSMLKSAWEKVTPTTITNCFVKAHFRDNEEASSRTSPDQHDDHTSTDGLIQGPLLVRLYKQWNVSASDYFNVDNGIPSRAHENIAPCAVSPPSTASGSTAVSQDSDSDNDDCGEQEQTVTECQVLDCVHKISLYLMQTGCSDAVLAPFSDFREAFEKHLVSTRTQTTVTQSGMDAQKGQRADGQTECGQIEEAQGHEGVVGEVQTSNEQREEFQRQEGQRERQEENWHADEVQIKEEQVEDGLCQVEHVDEVPVKEEQIENRQNQEEHAEELQINFVKEEQLIGGQCHEGPVEEVQIKEEQREEGQGQEGQML